MDRCWSPGAAAFGCRLLEQQATALHRPMHMDALHCTEPTDLMAATLRKTKRQPSMPSGLWAAVLVAYRAAPKGVGEEM